MVFLFIQPTADRVMTEKRAATTEPAIMPLLFDGDGEGGGRKEDVGSVDSLAGGEGAVAGSVFEGEAPVVKKD